MKYVKFDMRQFWSSLLIIICFFIISIIFLLLFPSSTSLLKDMGSFDTNIWRIIGWAWSEGKQPYLDIFDHKGPYQFVVYAIGNTPIKLFCLEALNLTFILFYLFKIGKLFDVTEFQNLFGIFIFLWMLNRVIAEGGQCEEWCLLPTMISLFHYLKYLTKKNNKIGEYDFLEHSFLSTFIYGLCFGFIAFNRINNGFIITMILVHLSWLYILKGKWQSLIKHIGIFLFGVVIIILPVFIYFGLHGTISQMLYCSFEYNFLYKGAVRFSIFRYNHLFPIFYPLSLLFFTNIVVSILYDIKYKVGVSFFAISMLLVVFVMPEWGIYYHYLISFVPLVYLSIVYIFCQRWKYYMTWTIIVGWLIVPHLPENMSSVQNIYKQRIMPIINGVANEDKVDLEMKKIISLIPKDERDSIASYNNSVGLRLWVKMNKVPMDKYFFNSPKAMAISPLAKEEIETYYSNTKPLWLFTNPNSNDKMICDILQQYELYYKSEEVLDNFKFFLWHRK